jgi:hypothetical protein
VTLLLAAGLGCARQDTRVPPDPEVTFAAHRSGDRLVLDRLPSGTRATLEPPAWLHDADAPRFVLVAGSETRAGIWIVGRTRVLVRRDDATTSPRTAEVLSEWEEGAIRLTLYQRDGPTLGVDRFTRARADGATPLTPAAPLRGTYRAAVRDAQGAPVGWLRVRIDPPAPRVYDGVLPEEIGDPLAAAIIIALDGEVAWIDEHPSGAR